MTAVELGAASLLSLAARRTLSGMATAARSFPNPELEGQVSGYWTAPWSDSPLVKPDYRPTGAVLPRPGSNLDELVALDLVSIDYEWYPLSEAGVYTYAHSNGLLLNERWRFVAFGASGATVYDVEREDLISPADVARVYGSEAASRCRSDRPAVQVKLTRHVA